MTHLNRGEDRASDDGEGSRSVCGNNRPLPLLDQSIFAKCMEMIGFGLSYTDENGILVFWNRALEQITGSSASAVLGRPIWEVQYDLLPSDLQTSENLEYLQKTACVALQSEQAEGEIQTFVYVTRHLDGQQAILRGKLYVFQTEKGPQLIHTVQAISQLWQSQLALIAGEAKFRNAVEQAGDVTSLKLSEEHLEHYTHQLEMLRQSALDISAELGLEALVWLIAPRALELLDGTAMALYLYNPELDRLELAISLGDNRPNLVKYAQRGESLAGEVWNIGKPVLLEDFHTGSTDNLNKSYWGKVAGAPMVWSPDFMGIIFVFSNRPFYENDLKLLELFSAHAAAAVRNARLHQQLSHLAVTDPLTGIYNRRYFFEIAEKMFHSAKRYKRPFSVVMFDLDHFKNVNDTFGHTRGDEILRAVINRCAGNVRADDVLGRYGGEEFVIALPGTDAEAALSLTERLRQALAASPVETESTPALVTASFGIASLMPGLKDLMTLLNRADIALYHAKQSGRNRVILWTGDMESENPGL